MKHTEIVTAIFRNGIFTPEEPVALPDGTRVQLHLAPIPSLEADEDLLKLGRETDYFAAQQQELQDRYPNQFVAIHNTQVVDYDEDEIALTLRIEERWRDEAILIKHVAECVE